MKVLIDIGHPAHVHYFRNTIKNLEDNGHSIVVTARNREFVFDLLKSYNISYYDRGKGKNTILGKLFDLIRTDLFLLKVSLKHKPDIFLSFSSHYAAQVACLLRKPHIAVNDTEHEDNVHSILTYPFTNSIITPSSFQNDLGKKQVRFDNVVEGLYLSQDLFKPDEEIKKILTLKEDEEYVILRFVSWNAHHDVGHTGISNSLKRDLIKLLETKFKVFISSEEELGEDFKKYRINIPPDKMHDALYKATLFVGESATMASESAQLGTQSIFINSLPLMCNIKVGQEAGLIKWFKSSEGVMEYLKELIKDQNLKMKSISKSKEMQNSFINPTRFLTWFVENYPESKKRMEENPNYQLKFK